RLESTLEGDKLYVEDGASLILHIPIRLRDVQYLQIGQRFEMQLLDQPQTVTALVVEIGKRVETMSYEQVVTIKALAEKTPETLAAGAPLRCRLLLGRVRLMEYLRRSVRWQM
ncbi:MAG: hypothetical protein HOP19_25185, partial [Acidobacteria bacterium]|nr:hypothetical protein [Acidobacteriota bacterium]